jgi:HEAT repeat protein/ATP/ADP translocase
MRRFIYEQKELLKDISEDLFKIQEHDWPKIIFLSVLNFFGLLASSFGFAIATTLFLKRYGIDSLPLMYLINAILSSITTISYFLIVKELTRKKIFSSYCFFFIIFICIARLFIELKVQLIYPLIYIISYLCSWLFYTQFWGLALDITDVREGKRIFSIIVCAGLTGGIIGGLLTKYFSTQILMKDMLILWALPISVIWYMLRYSPVTTDRSSSNKINIKKHIKYFNESKLVMVISGTFILYSIIIYILDFQFNFVMNKNYITESGLVKFYGSYTSWFYIVTLLIELIFTPILVRWLGVGNTMLIFPITLFLGFTGLTLFFSYLAVLLVKFVRDVVGNSVIESSYPLLFTPIRPEYRQGTILFIEGIVIPMGILLAGLLLIGLQNIINPYILSFIGTSLCILWIYITFKLKQVYISTFINNILERTYNNKEFLLEQYANLDKVKIIPVLKKALNDKNEDVNILAAEILGTIKHKQIPKILIEFLLKNKPKAKLRATIIRVLGKIKDPNTIIVISKYLKDPDSRVRANAIESLGEIGGSEVIRLIEPLLNDPNPRVKINAAIIFWRSGKKQVSKEIFIQGINHPDTKVRVRTVYALSMIATEELESFFYKALSDNNLRVRLYALRGLGKIKNSRTIETLIYMLSERKRILRREARSILKQLPESIPILINSLQHPNQQIRHQVALVLAETKSSETIEPLMKYCEFEIYNIYQYYWQIKLFTEYSNKDDFYILISTLNTRIERTIIQVLKIISMIENSQILSSAVVRLKLPDKTNRAAIAEIMENLPYRKLIKLLIPLIEEISIEQKVAFGKKYWEFINYSITDILDLYLNNDTDLWLKLCAIYLIGKLGYKNYIERLKQELDHPSNWVKEVTYDTLKKLSPENVN